MVISKGFAYLQNIYRSGSLEFKASIDCPKLWIIGTIVLVFSYLGASLYNNFCIKTALDACEWSVKLSSSFPPPLPTKCSIL